LSLGVYDSMRNHNDSWYVGKIESPRRLHSHGPSTGSAEHAIGYHTTPTSIADLYEDAPARQVLLEKVSASWLAENIVLNSSKLCTESVHGRVY